MRKILTLACALFMMGLLSTAARADPIGTPGNPCENDSCFGNIFTLSFFQVDATHFNVFVTVDTSGYTGAGTHISDLAIKVVPQDADFASATLVDAPGLLTDWTLQAGGLNAGGCDGSGNGFLCVNTANATITTIPDGIYQFEFDLVVNDAADWLFDSASIKGRYGINGNLTSEPITMQQCRTPDDCPPGLFVPEPSTLALLGMVLFAAGAATNRRRKMR